MSRFEALESRSFRCDWQGLLDNISRKGTPDRVYHIELFHDSEIRDAITGRYNLMDGINVGDPNYERKKLIAVNRFCGFDYVLVGLRINWTFHKVVTEDTAELARCGGRSYQEEHSGPITSWEDFETYPWPDSTASSITHELEWYQENLPEEMCIIGGLTGHFCEYLTWLMGYETLCYALFEQRDLVKAIAEKIAEFHRVELQRILQFDRVRAIWASDDMGFKTGLLLPPKDLWEFVLSGHKVLAEDTHATDRTYLLHSCGKLEQVIDDLVDDVKIDAKHSFEDTIEDVRQVKHTYGRKVALLGGIDVNFLCRSDEQNIRRRVRETLDVCLSGGGYCLGTGNSVANYIPLKNYLAMVDEGMLYCR